MPDELTSALDQIAEIRRQMARASTFRGYRAATVALTGVLAFLAAGAQNALVPDPWHNLPGYLGLWGGLATVCATLFAIEQVVRCRKLASPMQTERTLEAAERFIPSLAAGGLLTLVFYRFVTRETWMLPGLWAVCFSLGVFASRTLLPRGIAVDGGYYLLAGCGDLVLARGAHMFSPWAMALTFGVGQLLAAGVLYWNLERTNGRRR
jgi:hypothetical protein